MRKAAALLALVFLLARPLAGDTVKALLTAQATDTSVSVSASGYQVAVVTVWAASGSPDGTVRIYSSAPGAPLVLLATYATPSTAKSFRGPVDASLVVALTGNTTGTVSAVAVLK